MEAGGLVTNPPPHSHKARHEKNKNQQLGLGCRCQELLKAGGLITLLPRIRRRHNMNTKDQHVGFVSRR